MFTSLLLDSKFYSIDLYVYPYSNTNFSNCLITKA